MDNDDFGKQFSSARKQLGLTQAELADKCNLNIRTIQRIENGKVTPRFYTLNIINDVLGTNYLLPFDDELEEKKVAEYLRIFEKRKRFRLATFYTAIILMIAITLVGFPTWELFGLPKHVWAPYFYLLMFAHIIGIALTWRCPGCNAILGDVYNTRYCSNCGLRFYNQED
jgi:transcriptional regulator with XRE-family HTH domain